jgi:stalled ribosome alternative rescue factor ArfA
LDIRDNQLPSLVEDLRRQMVSKIESALSKNTTATVKADSVEQKVHLLAEHVKKSHGGYCRQAKKNATRRWRCVACIGQLNGKALW